ncbi:LuxR C-terminal-related transcriptional regulator [Microbulbifer hydrolyticus]|uniref:Response regulator n=1 Tax=Microbulbifer hydrolyticus TaxID=48074 RepID=A0A6P1TAZ4_9GAMM|nr:response regulator transcription factor [Microbulbifer hydrolyticus]MBB5212745.1 DNA-binding NarL/FixJ family response regulator [Microbulbifer hydrolyticus]QHQ38449.1 response regulator [Microbulbifer hydrolyticus]
MHSHNARQFIVADDHPLFRGALCQSIKQTFPGAEVIEACDMQSLQQCVAEHPDCDLLLLDLHMPGAHGFSGLIFLNGQYPQLPVMVVSANEKPEIMCRAIDFGACGFLPKSAPVDQISDALNQAIDGEIWLPPLVRERYSAGAQAREDSNEVVDVIATLTPQQFRVATMLAEGLLNKQIAYEMQVTEATVKAHLTALFRKLDVNSRTQAVLALSSLDVEPPGQFVAPQKPEAKSHEVN